jgi:seryl-tRNA synthetase
MHDIRYLRENPEAFDAAMARRGLSSLSVELLELDTEHRRLITEQGELQAERNRLAREIGPKKKAGEDAEALMQESKTINDRLTIVDAEIASGGELKKRLASLPNIMSADVPDGADESANVLRHIHGTKPTFSFPPKPHFELGEDLGMMDFEGAAKISGARFVVLKQDLARLERALAQFMLDTHTADFGYEEVAPPYLVRDNALFGTGQLPKFSEDLFATTDGRWLIPTAEVPLTNLVAGQILTEETLPIRMCAYTPCFRSEAGSAGRDTRGMIRQHQFSKVELVSITTPETSAAEHERMLSAAENILQKLGLHYRVMTLCSGDTGFCAEKTYDIEVWLPAQDAYREISSCSNVGGFQARRMEARYRPKGEKKTEYVHTLNGSGLAVGRTMVAILENYQNADGSITIPDALVGYMGGKRVIIRQASVASPVI